MSQRHLTSGDELPPLQPGVLRLYSMRYCPFVERTRLVACHKGIKCEIVNINLRDKPTWMFERNPNGAVPILEKDGKVLYGSSVIMEYLNAVYPGPNLTVSDPYVEARGKILCEHFGKVVSKFSRVLLGPMEEQQTNNDAFSEAVEQFEEHLPSTKFLCGDEVSIPDFYIWPWVERCATLKELYNLEVINAKRCPKLHAWSESMLEIPAVKAAMVDTRDMKQYLINMKNKKVDYDFAL